MKLFQALFYFFIFNFYTIAFIKGQEIADEDVVPIEIQADEKSQKKDNKTSQVSSKVTPEFQSFYENTIQTFEKADKIKFPPTGAIVCIGSSSMRFWHPTIEKDLTPLTLIPRGFGGGKLSDAVLFVNRIVTPYKPRAILLYAGENDIALGDKPEEVAEKYREFAKKVRSDLPESRIYFISIKPSVGRWYLWSKIQEANRLIALDCAKNKNQIFIDITQGMLNSEGLPRAELYRRDGYHLSKEGYQVWTSIINPILQKSELPFEQKKELPKDEKPEKILPLKPVEQIEEDE